MKWISTLVMPIAMAFCFGISHASAAPATRLLLEEIVVTARGVEENLTDVPVSVLTLDRARLDQPDMDTIAGLARQLPGLVTARTALSTRLHVRGIGSGNNQGFEQSVGQFVDGVYHGRQHLIRVPLFDLERVELLRGPQTILFGKNAIAGTLSLATAGPGQTREGAIDATVVHTGQTRIAGHVSGPVTGKLAARLAFRRLDGGGYLRNSLTGKREPDRREESLRLTLRRQSANWPDLRLKLESGRFARTGGLAEVVADGAAQTGRFAGLRYSDILTAFGAPATEFSTDYRRQTNAREFSHTRLRNVSAEMHHEIRSTEVTLRGAYVAYGTAEHCDCDYSPADIFEVSLGEDYRQFSQEFRMNGGSPMQDQWVLGAYYQHNNLRSREGFMISQDSFFNELADADPALTALSVLSGNMALRRNTQQGASWSLFGERVWPLSDRWRLTIGARYSKEAKTATRRLDILALSNGTPVTDILTPATFQSVFGFHSEQTSGAGVISNGHNLTGRRNEENFSPLVSLQRDLGANGMWYVKASRGGKAGGFDARANNPRSFEFAGESVRSLETGLKTFINGNRTVNVALFHMIYKNLQVSQYDGGSGFNVANAARTRVRGLEIDGRWGVTDNLKIGYVWTMLDLVFKNFRNGNCHNGRSPDGDIVNGVGLCDYSGATGQFAPRQSASLSIHYSRPLTSKVDFSTNSAFSHSSRQHLHDNLDPRYFRRGPLSINLELALESQAWRLGVQISNLLDEKSMRYVGNLPLTAELFATDTYYAYVGLPRRVALVGGLRF